MGVSGDCGYRRMDYTAPACGRERNGHGQRLSIDRQLTQGSLARGRLKARNATEPDRPLAPTLGA
jgi:hypothetical protein